MEREWSGSKRRSEAGAAEEEGWWGVAAWAKRARRALSGGDGT